MGKYKVKLQAVIKAIVVVNYDGDCDILYLSKGKPVSGYVGNEENNIMYRFDLEKNEPCGVTIERYSDEWVEDTEVYLKVAKFLNLPVKTITSAIITTLYNNYYQLFGMEQPCAMNEVKSFLMITV